MLLKSKNKNNVKKRKTILIVLMVSDITLNPADASQRQVI